MTFAGHFRGRRVLVTGDTGFKGGWLSLWLHVLGAEVFGYALPPDTEPSLFSLARIGDVVRHENGDLRDFPHLVETIRTAGPEVVFHLAAQPLVLRSYRDPRGTIETNVLGTANLLEAVRQTDSVRAVVVVTSDKCYENRGWVWGYRECDTLGGADPYSASKAAAELVVASYLRSFFSGSRGHPAVGVATVRAGNVIGGGDFADDRIAPDVVRAVMGDQPLALRSPGAVRPWQYVLEPLGGYMDLAVRLMREPARYSGAWNFGPNSSALQPVDSLATALLAALGRPEHAVRVSSDEPVGPEAGYLWLSSEKAAAELKWRPVYDFQTAVRRSGAWYRRVVLEGSDGRQACIDDIDAYARSATAAGSEWAL